MGILQFKCTFPGMYLDILEKLHCGRSDSKKGEDGDAIFFLSTMQRIKSRARASKV